MKQNLGKQLVTIEHLSDGKLVNVVTEVRTVYQDGERFYINWLDGTKDVEHRPDGSYLVQSRSVTIRSTSAEALFKTLGILK